MSPDEDATTVELTDAPDLVSPAIAIPEGAPDFNTWTAEAKLTYLCASVFALKHDIAQVKELAGQVASQAGPIIERVQSSPLLKMLGVR